MSDSVSFSVDLNTSKPGFLQNLVDGSRLSYEDRTVTPLMGLRSACAKAKEDGEPVLYTIYLALTIVLSPLILMGSLFARPSRFRFSVISEDELTLEQALATIKEIVTVAEGELVIEVANREGTGKRHKESMSRGNLLNLSALPQDPVRFTIYVS